MLFFRPIEEAQGEILQGGKLKIKFEKSDKPITSEQVIILMWVVVIPIAMLTMLIGKFMTCVLLGAAVWAYVNKQLNTPIKPQASGNNPKAPYRKP